MTDYPTFSEWWSKTTKVGRKELMAARWSNLPMIRRIELFNKVARSKIKLNPEEIL